MTKKKTTPITKGTARKVDAKETLKKVLEEIRKLPEEDQNILVEHLLRQLVIDQYKTFKSTKQAFNRSDTNISVLLRLVPNGESIIKEQDEVEMKQKNG